MTEFEITTLVMGIFSIIFAIWVKPTKAHDSLK
jgi:hypothetical protein